MYHGNGGYTWDDVYSMPTWLRKFTFKQIQDYLKKATEEPPTQPGQSVKKTWDPSQLLGKSSYK